MRHQSSASQQSEVCLSIIIPMFNEAQSLDVLMQRLDGVLSTMPEHCELVFIDDGSTDNTWALLQQLRMSHGEHQCIKLSRNFGKEAALSAGLAQARGLAVILLDADLQDPPELIPQMLATWREGYEVVNMRRKKRLGETWFKRFSAGCFYRLMNVMSDSPVPENVGDFRLLSRQVVDHINAMPERNRFMKGILSWPGFTQTTIEFDRDPRSVGETKWNYGKLIGLAMDGITSFSFKPLRLATWFGVTIGLSSLIYGVWVVLKTLVFGEAVAGYASMMVVQLFLAGIQLLAIGLIGEYLGRVFMEVKQRPVFIVEEVYHQQSIPNTVVSFKKPLTSMTKATTHSKQALKRAKSTSINHVNQFSNGDLQVSFLQGSHLQQAFFVQPTSYKQTYNYGGKV
ncbi:glycosyltransferase family 2 protein [Shewanella sp. MMG014]|uniref:glycosyltransferase family 2 protein n=1 Tax=Shewanella sp. MMG014 TaxID=2822691 RepID=UPI001B3636DF|nr:glycosyltransferase family 2 protein [Shewanella sp. MMG014]MBQ4891515.1 glycosyltransferase family 2 protein [Shewanella sp. MMG014]